MWRLTSSLVLFSIRIAIPDAEGVTSIYLRLFIRKYKKIDLQVSYSSTLWMRNVVTSLMALPLLYQQLINDQFDQIINLVDER